MKKALKVPKLSDKDIEELTHAAQHAYGNDAADKLLDEAFAYAEQIAAARRGERVRTE